MKRGSSSEIAVVPWIFLAVTLVGAAFTFNAYLPRAPQTWSAVPSFFAGWLTSELAAHHFAWQLVATVAFVWAGALDAWPGWLGLGITAVSWVALLGLTLVAQRSEGVVEKALVEGLGADYRRETATAVTERMKVKHPRGRLVVPFLLYDRDVQVVRDIPYTPWGGKRHRLDIYGPRGGTSAAPVLFQIHGGGWVIGHKRQQALPLMMHLAARGWICVAANYRLSPKATFPDHLVDLKRALAWVRANIAAYGGDPDFVAVTGGSAGGHLTALMGLTANDPRYQPGFENVDTRLQAAVPFYGVYDFTNRRGTPEGGGMRGFLERMVMKKKFADDPEAFRRASPTSLVHPDAPPFFVIHGTHDSLTALADARDFVENLRNTSKQTVAYAEIPGAQHAFEVFHSLRTRHVIAGVDRFLAHVYSDYLTARGPADAPHPGDPES